MQLGALVLATALMSALLAVVLGANVAVFSGRYRVSPVLSGSMGRSAPTGSLVVTEPVAAARIAVGDVIVFTPPGEGEAARVHRVIEITGHDPLVVVTKGDANASADPWSPLELRGPQVMRVRWVVPALGQWLGWLGQPGHLVLAAAGLGGAGLGLGALTRRVSRRHETRPRVGADSLGVLGGSTPASPETPGSPIVVEQNP